jgi:hypothetical protein
MRAGLATGQKIEQRAQSIGLERTLSHRRAQIVIGELHGMLRRQNGSRCSTRPGHGQAWREERGLFRTLVAASREGVHTADVALAAKQAVEKANVAMSR